MGVIQVTTQLRMGDIIELELKLHTNPASTVAYTLAELFTEKDPIRGLQLYERASELNKTDHLLDLEQIEFLETLRRFHQLD